MKCTILHDLPGRLRVHLCCGRIHILLCAFILFLYRLALSSAKTLVLCLVFLNKRINFSKAIKHSTGDFLHLLIAD